MIPSARKDNRKMEKTYSRYGQEDYKAREGQTGQFKIDTLGTCISQSLNALVAGSKR
jgi:hypothetical protein